jgi:hypothetical protein
MLIKKILFISVVFIFLGITPSVSAHFLATDHSMGVVLHTDPDDDPIAGSPTGLYFDVKDTTGKFVPTTCECTVLLYEGQKLLVTQPVFQNASATNFTAGMIYTFPKKDTYRVVFTGKPVASGAFQPFSLSWNLPIQRVENAPQPQNTSWLRIHTPHIVGIGIILIFFIILVISNIRKRGEK